MGSGRNHGACFCLQGIYCQGSFVVITAFLGGRFIMNSCPENGRGGGEAEFL